MFERSINQIPSITSNTPSIEVYQSKDFHSNPLNSRPSCSRASSRGRSAVKVRESMNKTVIFADCNLSMKENNERSISPVPVHFGAGYTLSHTSSFANNTLTFKTLQHAFPDTDDVKRIVAHADNTAEMMKAFDNYLVRGKEFDMGLLRKSQFCKLKRYKGCVFFGEVINEKRHGKGIMIYGPSRLYEGDWENDVKHGRGIEITQNGGVYEGGYVNGKPEGFGTFHWTNGEVYEGEWKNGLKHGAGTWKGVKDETYQGEWKNGKAEGYGVHTWRNGDRYEGQFKGFLKHGNGKEMFVNGDCYVGTYVNGKPEGFGEYHWGNGCNYRGEFKNGLRHGKGTWKKGPINCDMYEGDWTNDKKCGQGHYRWASGNYYQGSYFDDLRHGFGEMHWIDGSAYYGNWDRGIQHGEGKLVIPGKGVKRGIFQNNMLVDEALCSIEDMPLVESMTPQKPTGIRGVSAQSRTIGSYNEFSSVSRNNMNKTSIDFNATLTALQNVSANTSKAGSLNSIDLRMKKSEGRGRSVGSAQKEHRKLTKPQKKATTLTNVEMSQWIQYKELIRQLPKTLNDLNDPATCNQIRKLIKSKKKVKPEWKD